MARIGDEVPFSIRLGWNNLAFTAGMINAGGFLACRRFVSHVTGFATITGIEAVRLAWPEAIGAISIPFFFIFGTMTSTWFTEPRTGESRTPSTTPALILVAGIMVAATLMGNRGFFGPFGITEDILQDYFLLALLSFACGAQNATATVVSGSSIRPTHLTGTTTDLGVGLVRAWTQRRNTIVRQREILVSWRRFLLMITFVAGAVVGALIFSRHEYDGFMLPFTTSLLSIALSMKESSGSKATKN